MNSLRFIFLAAAMSASVAQAAPKTSIYGYVEGYYEKVDDTPSVNTTTPSENPGEFQVPNLNVMIQSVGDGTKAYINLSGADAGTVNVNNAWAEMDLHGEMVRFRIGKLYRPFGLYNEMLDAVPTYIGIESPELYDSDHLMLSRETNMMIHGRLAAGPGFLNWSLTTGNDDAIDTNTPLGVDLRWNMGSKWLVGASYYTSGGKVGYDSDFKGGVLPYWTEDEYSVSGIYGQYRDESWTVQVAYYASSHEGTRASDICTNTLDDRLNERFNCSGTPDLNGEFDAKTYYIRAGYDVYLKSGTLTPYVQYDYYENPEMLPVKSEGGDNEAGISNDGSFVKATLGTVYRPQANLALKLDYSQHIQEVDTVSNSTIDGDSENYGEVRFSFSYFWQL